MEQDLEARVQDSDHNIASNNKATASEHTKNKNSKGKVSDINRNTMMK